MTLVNTDSISKFGSHGFLLGQNITEERKVSLIINFLKLKLGHYLNYFVFRLIPAKG